MHMYRATKAKSTLVLGILFAAFILIDLVMAMILYDDILHLSISGAMVDASLNISRFSPSDAHNYFLTNSDAFNILLTIFAVIFTHSDYSKGFVKNTYCLFEQKWKLVWSKWTALMTWVTGIYVGYTLISVGLSALLLKSFENTGWGDFFRVFIVSYIGLVAFITLVFLITSLFRSPAGGMVIGIIIASGLLQTVERLIDILIASLNDVPIQDIFLDTVGMDGGKDFFKISDYLLDNVYLSYSAASSSGDTVRTILVSVIYAVLALGLVMFLSRKKDVKC